VLSDVPGLFPADGVSTGLLRAGEPRLRRQWRRTAEPTAVRSTGRARVPFLHRAARLTTS
jgi:hypothetical protein